MIPVEPRVGDGARRAVSPQVEAERVLAAPEMRRG